MKRRATHSKPNKLRGGLTAAFIGSLGAETVVMKPIPMLLYCPECGERHIDEKDGDVDWTTKPHHTHSCQHCGLTWRPAVVPTVGVRFLPGFKNGAK